VRTGRNAHRNPDKRNPDKYNPNKRNLAPNARSHASSVHSPKRSDLRPAQSDPRSARARTDRVVTCVSRVGKEAASPQPLPRATYSCPPSQPSPAARGKEQDLEPVPRPYSHSGLPVRIGSSPVSAGKEPWRPLRLHYGSPCQIQR
jgi:hypothetical protein